MKNFKIAWKVPLLFVGVSLAYLLILRKSILDASSRENALLDILMSVFFLAIKPAFLVALLIILLFPFVALIIGLRRDDNQFVNGALVCILLELVLVSLVVFTQ